MQNVAGGKEARVGVIAELLRRWGVLEEVMMGLKSVSRKVFVSSR